MIRRGKKVYFLTAFLCPCLALCAYFFLKRIAPFGDGTFLIHDMNAQYVEFFAYFKTVISGENDLTYSLSRGLGGDFRSFFAYYLASPVNLILLLFPDEKIAAGISVEMMILFGLCGISCFYSLTKFSEGPEEHYPLYIYLSFAYSLSACMLLNAENFQFIPEAAIIPMVIVSLRKKQQTGEILSAVIWLTIAVIVNFYIGYMIWLFAALWMLTDKDLFKRKTFLMFGIAGVLSSPIWFPAAQQLGASIKETDSAWYLPAVNFAPLAFLQKFLPGQFTYSQILDNGLPAIYCGLIPLLLVIAFFLKGLKGQFASEKRKYLVLILVLTASFFFRPFTMIWHGFSQPHWWPYRFAFLFVFTIILCASRSGIKVPLLILILGAGGLLFNMDRTLSVKLRYAIPASEYEETVREKNVLINEIKEKNSSIFRIEDMQPRTDNDAMHFAYSGITNFESLAQASSVSFLEKLGYQHDRYTIRYGKGGTLFANYLLGVRFVLNDKQWSETDIPVGLAFMIGNEADTVVGEASDPVAFQNEIASSLGFDLPVLEKIEPDNMIIENLECSGDFCWKTDPSAAGSITYTISGNRSGNLYAHNNDPLSAEELYFEAGDSVLKLSEPGYFLPIGKAEEGDETEVKIIADAPVCGLPDLVFYIENTKTLDERFGLLYEGIEMVKNSSSHLTVRFPASDQPQLLAVTLPYDSHWEAHSGKNELEIIRLWDTFIAVRLIPGITEADLRYR